MVLKEFSANGLRAGLPVSVLALAALGLSALGWAAPAMADVKAGVDAWSRKDYAAAIREWQGPAARGDADAEFDLGQAYKLGHGVPQDLTKAEQLFGQAAAQGHIQAGDNYGLLLFQRGEHEKAMPYIQAAAGRGDPRAEYLLGIAYFNADNVPKDWVRAYAYESMAQQAGLPQAKAALAQMDSYVPLEQRQQGVAMAGDLSAQAETNRGHAMASADLGNGHMRPSPAGEAMPPMDEANPAAPMAMAPVHHPRPRPAPQPMPMADSAPAEAGSAGGWKIQLGAFGVAGNAEAQWNRVKGMAGVAGHGHQMLPTGRVTRLMATGYSEASAHAACARLSASGIACIATRN